MVFAATTGVATAAYAARAHSQVSSIARTDAPSVHATSDFLLKVADMDAQLANVLLIHDDTTLAIKRADSMRLYEADRTAADADLTAVTAVLAGNAPAEQTLRTVADLFGEYQEKAVRAMQLDELAHLTTAGNAPANILGAYRNTLTVLEGPAGSGATLTPAASDTDSLLAQARLLDQRSGDAIQGSTATAQRTLGLGSAFTALPGLVLLALLGVLQVVLYRRFHRAVNPAAAAATVVALMMLGGGLGTFGDAGNRLTDATSNAFTSIRALTDAKALAYDANADESRWLLDRDDQYRYQQAFLAKSQGIAGVGDIPDLSDYEPRLGAWAQHGYFVTPDSAFGRELRNITYPGEDTAALDALTAFDTYQRADARLRTGFDLSGPGGVREAVDFDTNVHDQTTSDALFNAFSDSLDRVIALNQQGFDTSSAAALSGLGPLAWQSYFEALAIVALVPIGLRARLAEFR